MLPSRPLGSFVSESVLSLLEGRSSSLGCFSWSMCGWRVWNRGIRVIRLTAMSSHGVIDDARGGSVRGRCSRGTSRFVWRLGSFCSTVSGLCHCETKETHFEARAAYDAFLPLRIYEANIESKRSPTEMPDLKIDPR